MQKLEFSCSCIEVTDETPVDLPYLVQLDEEAVEVTQEQFKQIANLSSFIIQSFDDMSILQFCVYPSLENVEAGFIYDTEKDIHYIFI